MQLNIKMRTNYNVRMLFVTVYIIMLFLLTVFKKETNPQNITLNEECPAIYNNPQNVTSNEECLMTYDDSQDVTLNEEQDLFDKRCVLYNNGNPVSNFIDTIFNNTFCGKLATGKMYRNSIVKYFSYSNVEYVGEFLCKYKFENETNSEYCDLCFDILITKSNEDIKRAPYFGINIGVSNIYEDDKCQIYIKY